MDTNLSPAESREALLETLMLRLTVSPADPRKQNPQLFVGQLPDTLPFELPVPQGSRIIGGLARSPEHIDLVLDVPLPPEQALTFYEEQLLAAGWTRQERAMGMPSQGGFVHTRLQALSQSALFCKGPRGPSLTFIPLAERDGFTDVRLNLNLNERESPCGQSARMRREGYMHTPGYERLIPPLAPPAGARQMGGAGGGGSDSWHTSATVETQADLTTLTRHYASQLEQGGWTRTGEGINGPSAWHTWAFQDEDKEPWVGVFFMLKLPHKEGEYLLCLRIDWTKKDEHKSGWFSYAPLSFG